MSLHIQNRCDFTSRSMPGIPTVYRLNLNNKDKLCNVLDKDPSPIACQILSGLNGDASIRAKEDSISHRVSAINKNKKIMADRGRLNDIVADVFDSEIKEIESGSTEAVKQIKEIIQINDGNDMVAIKHCVHHLIGIAPFLDRKIWRIDQERCCLTSDQKTQYFQLMKKSGFLETDISTVEQMTYNPGAVINQLLKENSQINTLLLGCGKEVLRGGICSSDPMLNSHHKDSALSIDICSEIDPHVIADIYDERFWEGIPDDSMALISDHSNAALLPYIDNPKSSTILAHIHRVLKKEGRFQPTSTNNNSDEKELLLKAGFTLSDCKTYYIKSTEGYPLNPNSESAYNAIVQL